MITQPTYCDGYASPLNGDLLYPNLWSGCVGAWCPSLGPSGSVLYDHSGFGNNGTLTNGPTWNVSEGLYANSFDGSDDYIAVPHTDLHNSSRLTISLWVNPATANEAGYLIAKNSDGGLTGWTLYWTGSTDKVDLVGTGVVSSVAVFVDFGAWVHVCGVFDGTISTIYRNGKNVGSGSNTVPANSVALTIGHRTGSTSAARNFEGKIDDVRIYNRALVPNEVADLSRQGRGASYALAPRRRHVISATGGNRRRRVLIGACS